MQVTLILSGIAWIIVATYFWWVWTENPRIDLLLTGGARVALGEVVAVVEELNEINDGRTMRFDYVFTYTYRLRDGRTFSQSRTLATSDRQPIERLRHLTVPYAVEVEYLPSRPEISRIKRHSETASLWWKVPLALALLGLFVSPGVAMVRDGQRRIRNGPLGVDEDDRDES